MPEEVPLRPPSQVIPVIEGRPQIGHSTVIRMVPRSKGTSKDLVVRPNGRRVLKLIKDLGEGVRYGLASRTDTAPHEI